MLTAILLSGCMGVKTPPVSLPATPAIFVEYYRSGGLAGLDDRMVIFDNGVTVLSTKSESHEFVLNQSDLERLTSLFDYGPFWVLESNYTARRGSADYIKYTIRYHGKTVYTEDSAIPSSLDPVIDDLDRIIRLGLSQAASQPTSTLVAIPK